MSKPNPLPPNADSLAYVLFHLGRLYEQGRISPEGVQEVVRPLAHLAGPTPANLASPAKPAVAAPGLPGVAVPPAAARLPASASEGAVGASSNHQLPTHLPLAGAGGNDKGPVASAVVPVAAKPEGYRSASEVAVFLDGPSGLLSRYRTLSIFAQGSKAKPHRTDGKYDSKTLAHDVRSLAIEMGIFPLPFKDYTPNLIPEGFVALATMSSAEEVGGELRTKNLRTYAVYSPQAVASMAGFLARKFKELVTAIWQVHGNKGTLPAGWPELSRIS